ncbi:hypothetical protein WJX79_006580 [Trebouxia sp. C0005]
MAQDRFTPKVLACKSIPKSAGTNATQAKTAEHIEAIKREVGVLQQLRGSLNVACLEEVYEDDTYVHLLLEYCKGGELAHRIGLSKDYSEMTVASYMRSVLRTLTQCHSNHILHRDVKPGNFMLVSDHDKAPLKAVDFGLAVTFQSASEPRSDLGLEGTPWYMAPEVLSSEVLPASDVWSAGVMTYQLLTGQFPFDDKQNPFKPSVAKIWGSILSSRVNFNRSCWAGISDEAKDFVGSLLNRDPTLRPTAKEALQHPWLKGKAEERSQGQPLHRSVVQRIQRFAASSLFKRTIYQHIAEEWLAAGYAASPAVSCPIDSRARPLITMPTESLLQRLFSSLDFEDEAVDRQKLAAGFQRLGYKLEVDEIEQLLDQIVECLRSKLPLSEVQAALQQAMQEAQKHEQSMHEGLSFASFLKMLRSSSADSLDQFDDRLSGGGSWHGASPYERLDSLLEGSVRTANAGCVVALRTTRTVARFGNVRVMTSWASGTTCFRLSKPACAQRVCRVPGYSCPQSLLKPLCNRHNSGLQAGLKAQQRKARHAMTYANKGESDVKGAVGNPSDHQPLSGSGSQESSKPATSGSPQQSLQDLPAYPEDFVRRRLIVFIGIVIGYACYYLTRNSLTYTAPVMTADPALKMDITQVGTMTSIFPIAYGFSKFLSGVLGARTSPRVMLAGGLMATAIVNILFGFGHSMVWFCSFWALNGVLQGFGGPCCARILTSWFATKERGTYWGMWNIAHNLGGFGAPILAGSAARSFGWKWGMWAPGIVGVVIGLLLLVAVKDSPEKIGYPPVEIVKPNKKKDAAGVEQKESLLQLLVQNVLKNPYIWGMALTYFFIYVVRQGVTSWFVFYLMQAKGVADAGSAAFRVSGMELGGLFGSLLAGRISDALIAKNPKGGNVGKRVQVVIGYTVGVAAMLLAFWSVPATLPWLQWATVFMIGFFLYGPQMLIGLCGAELVGPESVGASEGFLGWIAYLGAANAGVPLSIIVKNHGWNAYFTALLAACGMAILLLAPMVNLKSYVQREALAKSKAA